ncbi:MAG: SPASM domain-containing protein [Erysipelotrichaceae bacterium]|jgi:uncharacterized protein|nr:SPASM domain-containing protein [Erysipelotrichaceae bacterium]
MFEPGLATLILDKNQIMDERVLSATSEFLSCLWLNNTGTIRFGGEDPLSAGFAWYNHALIKLSQALCHRTVFTLQGPLHHLDDSFISLLARYHVQISAVLSVNQDALDKPDAAFQASLAGIHQLKDAGLPVFPVVIIEKNALSRVSEIIALFAKEEVPFTLRTALDKANHQESLELHQEVLGYFKETPVPCHIIESEALVKGVFHQRPATCLYTNCLGNYLAIDFEGNLYPCHRFASLPQYRVGTIWDNPQTIEQNPVYQELLKQQNTKDANCEACTHFGYCHGGCLFDYLTTPKEKHPYTACMKEQAGLSLKTLFSGIRQSLAKEESSVLLKEHKPTPFLSISKDRPHPYDEYLNLKRVLKAYQWGQNGAPGKAFAYRQHAQQVYLNITNNCPLRCAHCSVSASSGHKDMPLKTAMKIITDAYDLGFLEVSLNGGEPFAYKWFKELLQKMKAQKKPGLRFALYTNLYLDFDWELSDLLLSALDRICVSIDGDEAEHDKRRGKGSYVKTTANITKLLTHRQQLKSDCAIWVRATLTKEQTENHLDQIIKDNMTKLGVDHTEITRVLPIGRAKTLEPFVLSRRKPVTRLSFQTPFYPRYSCSLGANLHITPDADIYPCWAYAEDSNPIGNANTGLASVYDYLWEEGSAFYSVSQNPKCKDCEVKYLCGGICYGHRNSDCTVVKQYYLEMVDLAGKLLEAEYGVNDVS